MRKIVNWKLENWKQKYGKLETGNSKIGIVDHLLVGRGRRPEKVVEEPPARIVPEVLVRVAVVRRPVAGVDVADDDHKVAPLPEGVGPDVEGAVELHLDQPPVRPLGVAPRTVDVEQHQVALAPGRDPHPVPGHHAPALAVQRPDLVPTELPVHVLRQPDRVPGVR